MVQGTDGDLYGTTAHGGANGYGTVFRVKPDGTLTTLFSFNGTNGAYPFAGLIQGDQASQESEGHFKGLSLEQLGNTFKSSRSLPADTLLVSGRNFVTIFRR